MSDESFCGSRAGREEFLDVFPGKNFVRLQKERAWELRLFEMDLASHAGGAFAAEMKPVPADEPTSRNRSVARASIFMRFSKSR